MRNGPALVIRGTLIGSLLVIILCWLSTAHIQTQSGTGVAYAASPSLNSNQPASPTECQVSSSYSQNILQWCEMITTTATQYGLSPDLIAAVILQESGGDAFAYSHSGAVGLMQVMPRDGMAASFECPNGPCFASRPTIEELQDPAFNLEFGTRMLAGLLGRYGNLRDALKAYGPMDVGYTYADKVLAIYENYR
jgi:soluble lytic murein transglycosylase-like protein